MVKKVPEKQDDNRTSKGQFKKGVSGNPSGRPKSESTVLREKLIENSDKVFSLLMEKLDEGDSAALKMCLDRLVPPLKAVTVPVEIDSIGDTLSEKVHSVFTAATRGQVSSDTASHLINALAGVAKIQEISELEQRITELEKQREH